MDHDPAGLLANLVSQLRALGVLTQPAVEAAFLAVPRHLFLPTVPLEVVYRDEAIPTKLANGLAISSSSQPAIMAIMLEQLQVRPGQRVLEIGAGTGYNAALLGHLVGPNGHVVTVDIDEDLVEAARAHLAAVGRRNVDVVCADGGDGYAPGAPYDRIILSVGAWDITPAWSDQLRPGGTLVLPLRVAHTAQQAIAFDKSPAGYEPRLISRSLRDCGFMLLRGAFAGPEVVTALGPTPGLTLITPGPGPLNAEDLYQWLLSAPQRHSTGLRTTEAEVFGSLALWLDLRIPALASLTIAGVPPPPAGWPCLFQIGGHHPACFSFVLLAPTGLAVLVGRHGAPATAVAEAGPFELRVFGYGPLAQPAVDDLLQRLAEWDQAGRPASSNVQLRVYSPGYSPTLAPGEVCVSKRWTQTVVTWPATPTA